MTTFTEDIATLDRVPAISVILNVVCETTRMGFAAVARVTEDRWIACSVLDRIAFGLAPGGELKVETTLCHEIRQTREPVVIDHVAEDRSYCHHHAPKIYGFQSYISMPIVLPTGEFFGTLCAIDPSPARLNRPEIIGMFKLFAELIAFHIDAAQRLARSESKLLAEAQISELREQFIGVLGHDLRSPLGAISMGTTLLADGGLDAEQTVTLEMMRRGVSRMSDLINDALDFTRGRLGGGIAVDSKCALPVEQVLEQVVEEVRARWPERAMETTFAIEQAIQYDRKRIAQLFTNLLSNAMIHGKPEQPIIVRAASAGGKFEFSVSNAAEQIPAPALERLFEPFSRAGASNYQQGLGLGLYIASQIAKSHGGSLDVISNAEQTTFTFTMRTMDAGPARLGQGPTETGQRSATPAEKDSSIQRTTGIRKTPGFSSGRGSTARSSDATEMIPERRAGARVLLIEDHADTLSVLTRLLTRRGHRVTPVPSGARAREEYARGTFDLIVSDLGLPDCSGFDLVAELQRKHSIPAIALSGYGVEWDAAQSEAARFVKHLTKPIDFQQLVELVNGITEDHGTTSTASGMT